MSGGAVILGFGPQPMDFFKTAQKACGKEAVIDQDVARMAGATFAVGAPQLLADLRKRLEAGALNEVKSTNKGLSEKAAKWLANGERGISSNTIFEQLTGMQATSDGYSCHPLDPADFRRCQLLLEQVPELQEQFYRMAEVSPEWERLVRAWPDIVAAMDAQAPEWRNGRSGKPAHLAYGLIKAATRP